MAQGYSSAGGCVLIWAILFLSLLMADHQSIADEEKPAVDKSAYTLFNPTPAEYMREFETDRPDKTESPYTLDAGHFAIEMGVFSYTYNHITTPDPSRPQHQILVGDSNVKVGILNNADLQFIFQSFIWEKFKTGINSHTEESGFADTQVRLKVNMLGNDEGKTAIAIMPWIGFPTNQVDPANDSVTGGLILPLQFEGPFEFKIGMMTEFDAINNSSGNGHHLEWVNTICAHHELIKDRLDSYVEFFSNNSFETRSPWAATVDVGLIYQVDKNLFIDCGVNIGVTPDADDVNPFIGFSKRF